MCWHKPDFLLDRLVQRMNPTQRWMYRQLLQTAWWCDWRPDLPNDDDELWLMAGAESLKQWQHGKPLILKKYESSLNSPQCRQRVRLRAAPKPTPKRSLRRDFNRVGHLGTSSGAKLPAQREPRHRRELRNTRALWRSLDGSYSQCDNLTDPSCSPLIARYYDS
jgi:hypothetical protein